LFFVLALYPRASCLLCFGLASLQLSTSNFNNNGQTVVFMIFVKGWGLETTLKDFHCCHVAFSFPVCCSLKIHIGRGFMVANLKLDLCSVLLVWVPTLLLLCCVAFGVPRSALRYNLQH
jgi:hypothetical protein